MMLLSTTPLKYQVFQLETVRLMISKTSQPKSSGVEKYCQSLEINSITLVVRNGSQKFLIAIKIKLDYLLQNYSNQLQ